MLPDCWVVFCFSNLPSAKSQSHLTASWHRKIELCRVINSCSGLAFDISSEVCVLCFDYGSPQNDGNGRVKVWDCDSECDGSLQRQPGFDTPTWYVHQPTELLTV